MLGLASQTDGRRWHGPVGRWLVLPGDVGHLHATASLLLPAFAVFGERAAVRPAVRPAMPRRAGRRWRGWPAMPSRGSPCGRGQTTTTGSPDMRPSSRRLTPYISDLESRWHRSQPRLSPRTRSCKEPAHWKPDKPNQATATPGPVDGLPSLLVGTTTSCRPADFRSPSSPHARPVRLLTSYLILYQHPAPSAGTFCGGTNERSPRVRAPK